ncbi:tRNA-specific 2-thiouridylase [Patescibacteria group bacterium]|nr:tRNA-specific 2-thiouridylase [Patescibacteria group bacterium]
MGKKQTVFVALSGGVDSSVAAALLQKEGFSVVGVHMRCWSSDLTLACTADEDERMARRAASHLSVPFYVWNFVEEYKRRVVDYMIQGYEQGLTPNPDIMCNKEVKFGLFFEKAMRMGAEYIATGHYARIRRYPLQRTDPQNPSEILGSALSPRRSPSAKPCRRGSESFSSEDIGSCRLLQARDQEKDQSYFLSFIRSEVLERVLFPLGEYTKTEVREMAKKLGLPNAERKDSQGICFVGEVEVGEFLRQYIASKEGPIVDTAGNVLGTHEGAVFYTIGQRKGIRLSGGPYYVVAKDVSTNTLTVSKLQKDILTREVHCKNVNWFSSLGASPVSVEVKLRYRQEDTPAILRKEGERECSLSFTEPQRAVTPGQFAVFYLQGELVGGGVIR